MIDATVKNIKIKIINDLQPKISATIYKNKKKKYSY